MIRDENFEQLELPSLLNKLSSLVRTPYGQRYMDELDIRYDRHLLEKELTEVSEMMGLQQGGYGIPLADLADIRSQLDRLQPEEAFLETADLNLVKSTLLLLDELSSFLKNYRDSCPYLMRYAERIHPHRSVVKEIEATIDSSDEIREDASRDLRRIRADIHRLENEQKTVLMRVLKRYQDFSQDDIVTMRDGRMVLGIQHQYAGKINGIMHSTSGTGATVFVEPMETLRISNQIQNLKLEERREIIRMLKFLSGLIREVRDDIFFSLENLGVLDFIHAKARLAILLDAHVPKITEESNLHLINGKHPLLILKLGLEQVVPASIEMGNGTNTLVITGPNAGGKTVTLKMTGLLCVMTMLGLPIPAHPDSHVPLYDNILVDIGDRQNLEQDLSTFTAHIIRLKEILTQATARSLVLVDELGTGTDPREGSALAMAFLEELTRRKTTTLVTTHHGELKAFAYNTSGVENASMEFNLDTLRPTYHLQVGIPGSSYAFEIARRYGLNEKILKKAIQILGSEKNQLENLIISLNDKLQQTERERREISIKLSESEGMKNLYHMQMEKLQKEKTELRRTAAAEARHIVDEANVAIERLIADIRKTQARKDKIKEAHTLMGELRKQAEDVLRETEPALQPAEDLREGDIVWIENLREEGEILSQPDDQHKVWVLVNDMRMNLKAEGMRKLPKDQNESRHTSFRHSKLTDKLEEGIQPELDLRGLDAFQAIDATNRYLDQAIHNGWDEIRIIHGKGTGVLRREINNFLAHDERVVDKRLGKWGEGDTGVTIVTLKKET